MSFTSTGYLVPYVKFEIVRAVEEYRNIDNFLVICKEYTQKDKDNYTYAVICIKPYQKDDKFVYVGTLIRFINK